MRIRSFMIGSTVETSLAKPVLHATADLFASQTFRTLLLRIPVHAFRHALMSMIGLCFSILSAPATFSVGNTTSLFHESGAQSPPL